MIQAMFEHRRPVDTTPFLNALVVIEIILPTEAW
jgi:hypothetical protein